MARACCCAGIQGLFSRNVGLVANPEFDENLYVQEFCKTQFADISVHILIIDLLKRIEPYFDNLIIEDEGEYLETADINLLQQHIDNCTRVSEEMKKENPKMSGPFRLKNGRIIDLMEDD
jgi:hypothetical protein